MFCFYRLLNPTVALTHPQQGIDWFKESMTRDEYRNQRIKEYETYLSCKSDDEDDTLEEQIQSQQTKPVAKNEEYYTFKSSKINEPCSIGHFQLRNLVWATNKNNVYYICKSLAFCGNSRNSRFGHL